MSEDPELTRLFLDELARHAPSLALVPDDAASTDVARRALHALKGSASLAGFRDLSTTLGRIERQVIAGDRDAVVVGHGVIIAARDALLAGHAAAIPPWPEPPPGLLPRQAPLALGYADEMRDRLTRLDAALGLPTSAAISAVHREIHAMKGAALAVSDDAFAWFCHGLEERVRDGERSEPDAALAIVARYRLVLGEMLVAPDKALTSLRGRRSELPPPSVEVASHRDVDARLGERAAVAGDAVPDAGRPDDTVRVATARLDHLFERVRQIAQARGEVTAGARLASNLAARSRQLRSGLTEALRLIGPPRPWGTPAAAIARLEEAQRALAGFGEQLDEEAILLKETADRVRVESLAAHAELADIRTTRASALFDRIVSAMAIEARRQGREARFVTSGEETGIDRRVADQLVDPLLQLARNAVAHGVEPAAERAMRGKPRVGVVALAAERRSGGLRVTVRDDGAGVDIGDVRSRAIALGMISVDMARTADDATLLALLFVPGFTTRDGADLLAGRGVGLDVVLEAVHRLGGTIRLASAAGSGLTAVLDIPFEPGLIRVVWLDVGPTSYALPIGHAGRVHLGKDAAHAPLLAELLGAAPGAASRDDILRDFGAGTDERIETLRLATAAAFALEVVGVADLGPALIGVDAVGPVEEVALRGLSPLVRTAGPYAGAILRGDEIRLCLDGTALAELATR